MNLYKQVKHLYSLLTKSNATIKDLEAEIEYLKLEMAGTERAKQQVADLLGVGDEPRWKWILLEISKLKREKGITPSITEYPSGDPRNQH